MKKISNIVSRIKEVKGLKKDYEVSEALDMTRSALTNHKLRDSIPYEYLSEFCDKERVSLDWLLTGEGPKYRNEISGRSDISECAHGAHTISITNDKNIDSNEETGCVRTSAHTKSIAGGGMVDVKESSGPGDTPVSYIYKKSEGGYLQVPYYDVSAAAGPGAYVDTENITDYFAFKSRWVKGVMGLDPNKLALISAIGDSMEPTLREGDLILVDLRETQVIEDSIYILRLDDRLFAKRLQRLYNGNIIIKSDNRAYEMQTVPKKETADLAIIGRAVWVGRRI